MHLLTENFGLKLMSLAVAVLLWMATVGDDTSTAIAIPIQFRNIPADLEISSELPDSVSVEVRAPASRLSNLSAALVLIDLGPVKRPGERTFSILSGNAILPYGVRFVRAVPSQVRLKFEPRLTREVPVMVRYASLPDGYHIVRQEVAPARVRIVGPESHVNGIDRVQTDPIELPGDDEELTFRVHAFAGDPQVRLESPDQFFTINVTLEKDR